MFHWSVFRQSRYARTTGVRLSMPYPNHTPRHQVFVSFHHADARWKTRLLKEYSSAFINTSVRDRAIDDRLPAEEIRKRIRDRFIRNATVTIVLIGNDTWRRKHVDWEMFSALRASPRNSRTGLMGIVLPDYRLPRHPRYPTPRRYSVPPRRQWSPRNVPMRLVDNVVAAYASIRPWPQFARELRGWIHESFESRATIPPAKERRRMGNNRRETSRGWGWR